MTENSEYIQVNRVILKHLSALLSDKKHELRSILTDLGRATREESHWKDALRVYTRSSLTTLITANSLVETLLDEDFNESNNSTNDAKTE